MIVDAHAHMLYGKGLDALVAAGGPVLKQRLDGFVKQMTNKPGAVDVANRVAALDRSGIDYQLATPMPGMDPSNLPLDPATELKTAIAINDNMAKIMDESKGRILCAGAAPMAALEKGGLNEMERAVKTLGLRGFGTMTNIKGKPHSTSQFHPFWAKAAELGATVFIHPLDTPTNDRSYEAKYGLMHVFGWPFETTLALSHIAFSGILDQSPDLKLVTHHLGGMIPFYWGRMKEFYVPELIGRSGIELKKPLKEYFGKFFYDSAVGDNPSAIKCTYEIFGVDHVVFATDFPFGPGTGEDRLESYQKVVKSLGLPKKDTARIMGETAKKLLGIR